VVACVRSVNVESPWRGRSILITGATGGIGTEAARRFARDGATLLVHGRSRTRVEALVRELETRQAPVIGLASDLSSLEDVVGLARSAVIASSGTLDVLINNAGVGFGRDRTQRETSRDGFELRWAVNYLAPFVLTHELLARGTPTRAIVNVASIGQEAFDTDDLGLERAYDGVVAYRRSKLALIMHTFDVAADVTSIASNALHPGAFLDTAMVRDAGIAPRGPATRGADVIAHVLARALRDKTTGCYFDELREARPNAQAFDREARARLRDKTLALTAPFRSRP